MLGVRQKEVAAELAQWWDGVRQGGAGSHAVLLVGPEGWGRSTVLDQLPDILDGAHALIGPLVRINARSLPDELGQQALAVRDGLLGTEVRRQAAALLCRSRLRGAPRLGIGSLLTSGIAGTMSLLVAGLAAAARGCLADDTSADASSAAARAAQVVAAVSASAPILVAIDDADYLEPGLALTVIENLIDQQDSQLLVVAAVDLDSDVAAALTSRARYGPTAGRVHRAGADPRMGHQSRAQLAGELNPHLTAAEAEEIARQTRTFAEIFTAARSQPLS
ncbi:MAG TPA: AAA family ATPase [Streptosporangiaceae bacterium]|nr:AAA family ATPase [Streptosporangiaceae bacterium]